MFSIDLFNSYFSLCFLVSVNIISHDFILLILLRLFLEKYLYVLGFYCHRSWRDYLVIFLIHRVFFCIFKFGFKLNWLFLTIRSYWLALWWYCRIYIFTSNNSARKIMQEFTLVSYKINSSIWCQISITNLSKIHVIWTKLKNSNSFRITLVLI